MNRQLVQVDIFGYSAETKRLRDGSIIDKRHVAHIDPLARYQVSHAAIILDCSIGTVYTLCSRMYENPDEKEIDVRHFQDFRKERNYTDSEIARKFNCSRYHIYRLRKTSVLQQIMISKHFRTPGWSVINLITDNASPAANSNQLEYLILGNNLKVIPGWSLIDYIENSCTRL